MPSYDYRCEANDRVVEVKHGMNEKIATWGELCERAGIESDDTPEDTPVTRLITGGAVISHAGSGAEPPPCATGTCGGGFCGLD
jgi:hypothetical protein